MLTHSGVRFQFAHTCTSKLVHVFHYLVSTHISVGLHAVLYGHRSNWETHWGCQFGWKQLTEFDVVLAVIGERA